MLIIGMKNNEESTLVEILTLFFISIEFIDN